MIYGYIAIPSKFYDTDVIRFMYGKADEVYVNDIVEFISYHGNIDQLTEKFFQERKIPYNIEMDDGVDGKSTFHLYRPQENQYVGILDIDANRKKIEELLKKYPLRIQNKPV